MNWPEIINERYNDLLALITKYPNAIPLVECAKFLHMDPESLRCVIEQQKCGFGLCWRNPKGVNKAYLIPTIQFYFWITNI